MRSEAEAEEFFKKLKGASSAEAGPGVPEDAGEDGRAAPGRAIGHRGGRRQGAVARAGHLASWRGSSRSELAAEFEEMAAGAAGALADRCRVSRGQAAATESEAEAESLGGAAAFAGRINPDDRRDLELLVAALVAGCCGDHPGCCTATGTHEPRYDSFPGSPTAPRVRSRGGSPPANQSDPPRSARSWAPRPRRPFGRAVPDRRYCGDMHEGLPEPDADTTAQAVGGAPPARPERATAAVGGPVDARTASADPRQFDVSPSAAARSALVGRPGRGRAS